MGNTDLKILDRLESLEERTRLLEIKIGQLMKILEAGDNCEAVPEPEDEPVRHPEKEDMADVNEEVTEEEMTEAPEEENVPGGIPIIDRMIPDTPDWMTDIAGERVEYIRDGISLNDRMLFVSELFGGDADGFASAVAVLDGMERLDDAVKYLEAGFPEWDMHSDTVYRFMMAVRRKIRR